MDAPPPGQSVGPFVAIAELLANMGYCVPDIHAVDEKAGFVLLEDLGDDTFVSLLAGDAGGALEDTLYEAAIDLLLDLHGKTPPEDLPCYDRDWLLRDASLFLDTALTGSVDRAARRDFDTAWDVPLGIATAGPQVLCLRDFHVGNLMWLPSRGDGVSRVGLLDFQDARRAPAAYDVVSLLQDARRDLRPGLADAMMVRYLATSPRLDEGAFRATYAILGAQRCVRIIGIFMRLAQQDGKRSYLMHLPRVWAHLETNLREPVLAPVRAWFDTWLPARAESVSP
jgi:aminoglycoside/choline kinase family phosphotransferase